MKWHGKTEILLKPLEYNLYEGYKATNNTNKALEHYEYYIKFQDSIFKTDNQKQIIRKEMDYEFEKKEAIENVEHKKEIESQNAIAEEKSRKQKTILNFVIFGLLLVIIFAGIIFKSLKIVKKQKAVIKIQRNSMEEQKIIVEEKQKDILDSIHYAKRIQQSLMPTEKYINNTIKRLLKNKFN